MSINWIEVLHVLRIWSVYIGLYGFITITLIATMLFIHTKVSKDKSCNIKLLRKILS